MTTYRKEILTVLDDMDVVIGFICRRSVIFGIMQEIPDGWITGTLVRGALCFSPRQENNYATRMEARKALEALALELREGNSVVESGGISAGEGSTPSLPKPKKTLMDKVNNAFIVIVAAGLTLFCLQVIGKTVLDIYGLIAKLFS